MARTLGRPSTSARKLSNDGIARHELAIARAVALVLVARTGPEMPAPRTRLVGQRLPAGSCRLAGMGFTDATIELRLVRGGEVRSADHFAHPSRRRIRSPRLLVELRRPRPAMATAEKVERVGKTARGMGQAIIPPHPNEP